MNHVKNARTKELNAETNKEITKHINK